MNDEELVIQVFGPSWSVDARFPARRVAALLPLFRASASALASRRAAVLLPLLASALALVLGLLLARPRG